MRGLGWVALAAIVAGVFLLGYSVAVGESQVHLVLIFPVVTGGGAIGLLGIALIFASMFLGFLSYARLPLAATVEGSARAPPTAPPISSAPPKFGGVVFLGPIPIVFGSDPRISKVMLAVAVVMTLLLLAFFFLVLANP